VPKVQNCAFKLGTNELVTVKTVGIMKAKKTIVLLTMTNVPVIIVVLVKRFASIAQAVIVANVRPVTDPMEMEIVKTSTNAQKDTSAAKTVHAKI
jgi:hypothetical protein